MTVLKFTPFALALLLASCAKPYQSSIIAHPTDQAIFEIDQLVVQEKNQYINQCYWPIRSKRVPENRCQNKLFELVERRSGTKYSVSQLNVAAEEIFFNEVDDKIQNLINSNAKVRSQVKKKFTSFDELISYYKQSYHFRNMR